MTLSINLGLTIAVICGIVAVFGWLGFSLLHILIGLAIVGAIVYFVPTLRTKVIGWLSGTVPSVNDLLDYADDLFHALEAKVTDLLAEVEGHRAVAAEASRAAAYAESEVKRAQAASAHIRALKGVVGS